MSLIGKALTALAAIWTAASLDVIVESADARAGEIRGFGRSLLSTTGTTQLIVLVVLAVVVGALVEAFIGYRLRRKTDRALLTTLDERWQEVSVAEARVEARSRFLDWRVDDLQQQIDELVSRRDELVEEEHSTLSDARKRVRTSKTRDKLRQRSEGALVVLPDLAPEAAEPPA